MSFSNNSELHRKQEVTTNFASTMSPEARAKAIQNDVGAKLTNFQTGETVVYNKMKEREEKQEISPEEIDVGIDMICSEISHEVTNQFASIPLSPDEQILLQSMSAEMYTDFSVVFRSMLPKAIEHPEVASLMENFQPEDFPGPKFDRIMSVFGEELHSFVEMIQKYERKYGVLFQKLENQNTMYYVLHLDPQGNQRTFHNPQNPQQNTFAQNEYQGPEAEPVAGGKVNSLLHEYHLKPNAPYARIVLMSKLFLAGVDYGVLIHSRKKVDTNKAASSSDEKVDAIPRTVSAQQVENATPKKQLDQLLLRLVGLIQFLYTYPKLKQVEKGELIADADGGNERVTTKGTENIAKIGEKIDKKYKTPFDQFVKNGTIKTVEDAEQFEHVVTTINTPIQELSENNPDALQNGLSEVFKKSDAKEDTEYIVMFNKLKVDPFAGKFAVALDEYYIQLGEKNESDKTMVA